MKSKELAIDFDGTLCTTGYPESGAQLWIHKLIARYVRKKKKQGWIIILNTLRTKDYVLDQAIQFCQEHDIPLDYINENNPENVCVYGESRKIGADIHIDDKNIGFLGWLLRTTDKRWQKHNKR